MVKHRDNSRQALQRLCALKAALRSLHEGPNAIPRKVIYDTFEWHNATYSRYLNDDEPDFPDLLTVMAITALTGNPAVLKAALESTVGDDYQVTRVGHAAEPQGAEAFQLLSEAVEADHALTSQLLQDLEDGKISRGEAKRILPVSEARLANAQKTDLALRRIAAPTEPLRRVGG